MNRRQLTFLVLVNAVVSLVIALGVVWIFETRRPDPEELAAIYTPRPQPILVATAAPLAVTAVPAAVDIAPSQVLTSETSPTASGDEEIYFVKTGDSLLAIATSYNLSVEDIVQANKLTNPDFVFSGQRLIIPVKSGSSTAGGSSSPVANTPAPVSGVQISQVEEAGNLTSEAILVVNESNTPVSLQGWRLARNSGPSYNFGNVPLFPGGSVRIHSGIGFDTSIDLYWGQAEAVWPSGTVARLFNVQGSEVNTFTVP